MKYNYKYSKKDIKNLIKKEPLLKSYIEEIGFIKRKINTNIYESLVTSIISQQISSKAASAIINKLIKKIGKIKPKNILKLTSEDYQKIGIGPQKRGYIINITQSFLKGDINSAKLKKLENEQIIKELVKLKGVGEWTAQMILIFSLAKRNILPKDDFGIKKGLMKVYNKTKQELTPTFFKECYKKFSPNNTLLSLYLWEIASLK